MARDIGFQKSKEALAHQLEARPNDPDLLVQLADHYQGLNQHEQAARYYQAAYDCGRETVRLIENLVLSLRYGGQIEASNVILSKYLDSPKLPRRLKQIAAMNELQGGNFENAAGFIRQILEQLPKDTFAQAMLDTILAGKCNYEAGMRDGRRKIAFHMNEGFHYAIMKPIFDILKQHYDVYMTGDPYILKDFDPDFIFVANKQAASLRTLMPKAKYVYTRHGLISKNFIYDAAHTCDYVCVTSEDQQMQFIEEGGFSADQVWLTGYAQMVPLFKKSALPISLEIPAGRKCVLYAPTYTRGLSSIPMIIPHLTDGFMQRLGDVVILIKPHPLVKKMEPDWYRALEKAAETYPNIHLIKGIATDVVPYLQAADLLISDASSVIFQYLALDRPVIALNNPARRAVIEYDPNGIEWRWRDMMEEIEDVSLLPEMIHTCLDNPSARATMRAQYRGKLFGSVTDGKTGERIADYLATFFTGNTHDS